MRTFLVTLVAALLCWPTPSSRADEEASTQADRAESKDVIVETGDGKTMRAAQSESKLALVSTATDFGKFSRLPFRVAVSVRGGYDDNILTTTLGSQGSAFTNANVAITYDFGGPRTKLSLATGGGVTYFIDRPTDSSPDLNAYLGFTITHKATPRLTLLANIYASYQVEPEFAFNVGLNRRSGNFFYTNDKIAVAFLLTPRFSTITSFTFGAVNYDDAATAFYQDRRDYTFGNEFRFLLQPTTAVVAEYRFGIVDYAQIARSSTRNFLLGGFDHSFSPRLNLIVRAGEELRSYEDNSDRNSPYFESTLNYTIGPRSSAALTVHYSIEEPNIVTSQSRTTFRTGLQVKYEITPRISGTLGAYFALDDYGGLNTLAVVSPAFTEESFDLTVAVRYAITRTLAFEIGLNHTEVTSDVAPRGYSRNRYYGSLNFSF